MWNCANSEGVRDRLNECLGKLANANSEFTIKALAPEVIALSIVFLGYKIEEFGSRLDGMGGVFAGLLQDHLSSTESDSEEDED